MVYSYEDHFSANLTKKKVEKNPKEIRRKKTPKRCLLQSSRLKIIGGEESSSAKISGHLSFLCLELLFPSFLFMDKCGG